MVRPKVPVAVLGPEKRSPFPLTRKLTNLLSGCIVTLLGERNRARTVLEAVLKTLSSIPLR